MDTMFALSSYLLGALTGLGLGYLLFKLRPQPKRLSVQNNIPRSVTDPIERLIEGQAGVYGAKPVALAISLLEGNISIESNVTTFLQAKGWQMPIKEFRMPGIGNKDGGGKTRDLAYLITELQGLKRELQALGHDEIHLFIAGPVQAGTIIGALFDNWVTVKLYHKPTPAPPEVYEYWTPLIST